MNILDDIKRGPYSKKPRYAVVRYKDFGELIQPFKDAERVSQLDRKLLKTTGLDCLSFLEIAKSHDEHSNLIKEIQASTDFSLRNKKASIKALKIQVRQMSIILHKKLSGNLQSSTKIKPRGNDKTISTSVKADKPLIHRIDVSQYAVLNLQNRNLFSESKKTTLPSPNHLNDDYWDELKETDGEKDLEAHYTNENPIGKALPRKKKHPGSFTLPCFINNMRFNKALADLGASVRIAENVLVGIDKFTFPVDFIILDILEDFKTPLILGRPFLSTAHAIINVFKAKITLSIGNDRIMFKINKPASNIIKRVYALSLIKSTKLNLEARLMGNALRKNRSHDPKFEDYIEINDLNVPLELRRDQVDDLIPTIKEGEVIKEIIARNDARTVSKICGYPSDYDQGEKIRIDCAHNLKFSCMIGFEFIHANFLPNLPINGMSKKFYNSIMKDKIKFKGRNVLGN
ncbi:reverse transcriptase domain-containing protein [Tanacetum coccineum]